MFKNKQSKQEKGGCPILKIVTGMRRVEKHSVADGLELDVVGETRQRANQLRKRLLGRLLCNSAPFHSGLSAVPPVGNANLIPDLLHAAAMSGLTDPLQPCPGHYHPSLRHITTRENVESSSIEKKTFGVPYYHRGQSCPASPSARVRRHCRFVSSSRQTPYTSVTLRVYP